MRRSLRFALRILALAVVLAVLGTIVPRPIWPADTVEGPPARRIYVISNPIHTDIAIPVDAAVLERFRFLAEDGIPANGEGVRYLIFGWGGRAFYLETPTWSQLKATPVFKALTVDAAATRSSIRATYSSAIRPKVIRASVRAVTFSSLRLVEGLMPAISNLLASSRLSRASRSDTSGYLPKERIFSFS